MHLVIQFLACVINRPRAIYIYIYICTLFYAFCISIFIYMSYIFTVIKLVILDGLLNEQTGSEMHCPVEYKERFARTIPSYKDCFFIWPFSFQLGRDVRWFYWPTTSKVSVAIIKGVKSFAIFWCVLVAASISHNQNCSIHDRYLLWQVES